MRKKFLSVPYVVWMAFFVVMPLILIVVYAFTTAEGGFTLVNIKGMASYAKVFGRSLALSGVATLVSLIIGYPFAYIISKESPFIQRMAMMLIMLPMWINFILRTYSWMTILENTGLINQFLTNLGFFELLNTLNIADISYLPLINNSGAIIMGMVYNYLPFMIMPIYSVIVKLDPLLLEAARDLGAGPFRVFTKVIFPLSLPGVLSGITMVFVPSISTFAISKMLGGNKELLLGDLIEMQFTGGAYNPHLGSAISLVMMIIVMICMYIMNRFGDGEEGAVIL